MKRLIALLTLSFIMLHPLYLNAQTINIKTGNEGVYENITNKTYNIDFSKGDKACYIQITDIDDKSFVVFKDGLSADQLSIEKHDNKYSIIIEDNEYVSGSTLTIREAGANEGTVLATIVVPLKVKSAKVAGTPFRWILDEDNYGNLLNVTNYGLTIDKKDMVYVPDNVRQFTGPDFVHLFFDGNGNSIITTVPQGIANMQYVVHIVYLSDINQPPPPTIYSLKQTTGSFSSKLVFKGEETISELGSLQSGKDEEDRIWVEEIILLSTSTSDIEFDIIQTSNGKSTKISTQKIKMSPVYFGAFEVGLLNSELENPNFEFVPFQVDTLEVNTVVRKNGGKRGIVTIMATLYTSPIILLESLFGKDIPEYQLYGRNFLNDHKWYERIYPTVGLRLNTDSFENLFIGMNFELTRGGSVFVGGHYGEVNTFSTEDGIIFGESVITESEYSIRKDKEWDFKFAMGINLDVSIVKNLFMK